MIIISESQLSLLQIQGFIDRYHFYQGLGYSCKMSYFLTEEECEGIFKIRKYKSYESFRNALYRYLKNRGK